MTQVASKGTWSGVALPVRVHELLLALAGRLDDDALADARELVASSEVDRALELVVGTLAAGPIPVSRAEHDQLRDLVTAAHCDAAVVDRLPVGEPEQTTRHRFTAGKINGVGADQGVAEAAGVVLDVLPDIRAVWAVWRVTPAGAATGPVPHRVVLIGVGPAGLAPATAFRVEHALRRAGVTASVEVLRDGTEPSDYHHTAMRYATEVSLDPPPPLGKAQAAGWVAEQPPSPQAADEALNDEELDVLRQLQEEMARRDHQPDQPAPWQPDPTTKPFEWDESNSPTMVNGVPLQPPTE